MLFEDELLVYCGVLIHIKSLADKAIIPTAG